MFDYLLVQTATQYPGACVCGTQTGPLVDTSIELVGNQRVYLCERCVRQAAGLFGMQEATLVAKLETALTVERDRVRELETEVAEAAPILGAVAAANRRYGDAA